MTSIKKVLATSVISIAIAAESSPALAQALEEVIVSARKRDESLQETPVSVTSVAGDVLVKRGVVNFRDLTIGNPNVRIEPNRGSAAVSTTVAVRGSVQSNSGAQLDDAVGIYLDDMIIAKTFALDPSLVDLVSVQTLKGPQGTLFGRNTTGGAMLITTEDPLVGDRVSGYVSAEAGEEDTWGFEGAVNIPLGERSALRLVGSHKDRGDYLTYDDGTELGERESDLFRAKFLTEFTDSTSLKIHYEYTDVEATSAAVWSGDPSGPDLDRNNVAGVFPLGPITIVTPATLGSEKATAEAQRISLELTHETGWGEVKFLTGQREAESELDLTLPDGLGYSIFDRPELDSWMAELQLTANLWDDRVVLTSGLYYFEEETIDNQTAFPYDDLLMLGFPPVLSDTSQETDSESTALYGQATMSLTDALNLTLGLRYTDDERETGGHRNGAPLTVDQSDDSTDYLVTLDYSFNDNVMAYATTSTAYRAGGANTNEDSDNPGQWDTFEPEEVESYEVGIKSELLDSKIRLNGALFHQAYENYQYTFTAPDSNGVPVRQVISDDVEIQGAEIEFAWLLPADWTIDATAGYTSAEYDGGPNDGAQIPNIPELTYSLSVAKLITTSFGDFDLRAIYNYGDETYNSIEYPEETTTEERDIVNISATWVTGPWSVQGFVNNLLDDVYYDSITYQPGNPSTGGFFGLNFSSVSQPRIAGVRVRYEF